MRAQIEIKMDNAAFNPPNAAAELVHILRDAASRLEAFSEFDLSDGFSLRDSNGNKVGRMDFID